METLEFLRVYANDHLKIDLIKEKTSNQRSPLHYACGEGKIKIIEFLLNNGADINAFDYANETPIFYAVKNDCLNAVELLLQYNTINVLIHSKHKHLSILHYACGKPSYLFANAILEHIKAKPSSKKLLKSRDIDKKTPLFSAVTFRRKDIVQLLLENNATPNRERDSEGRTALIECVNRQICIVDFEIVKLLIEKGGANVNLRDKYDISALGYAMTFSSDMYNLLINKYGAETEIGQPVITLGKRNYLNSSNQGTITPPKKQVKLNHSSNDVTGNVTFDQIKIFEKIGAGSFGRVHRGEWLGTTTVALKFFSHDDEDKKDLFCKEIELLKSLHHPNIIHCYGDCFTDDGEQCMVMEYLPFTLQDALDSNDLNLEKIISIAKNIASGMVYLHNKQIIHRDLKPSNILLSVSFEPKIADFGVSRPCDGISTMTSIGTPLYMAPEMIRDKKYGSSADVYSFAMIFLQLFTKKKLFYELGAQDSLSILFQVVKHNLRPNIPSEVPSIYADLIRKWLVFPPPPLLIGFLIFFFFY